MRKYLCCPHSWTDDEGHQQIISFWRRWLYTLPRVGDTMVDSDSWIVEAVEFHLASANKVDHVVIICNEMPYSVNAKEIEAWIDAGWLADVSTGLTDLYKYNTDCQC